MAIQFGNSIPTEGKWINTGIDAIRHTDGNIYKFVDEIEVNTWVEQIINCLHDPCNNVSLYTNGNYTPYYDYDYSGDYNYDWGITSSGLNNGTIWTAPHAGVLKNAILKITHSAISSLGGKNLEDDRFSVKLRTIALTPNKIIVNKSNSVGPYGELLENSYTETFALGDLSMEANSRIYLRDLVVDIGHYDCVGHIRYFLTGILV